MSGLEKKNFLIFNASVARALINAGSLQQNKRRRPSETTPSKCKTVTKVPSEVRFSTRNHSPKPANEGGTSVTLKGCVSRSLCTASKSSVWGKKDLRLTEMSCCKGNLCNSAAGVKLSLLIMLVPLLSSFFL
ncbi:hypothetical protein NFI96_025771 [Prochilodus magdalenae]|nr:hypothetical protein NFI96_025771 [Prochilodus magdalenae]